MLWTKDFRNHIELVISNIIGGDFNLKSYQPVSGGDINQAYLLTGERDRFFMKMNSGLKYPGLFKKEVSGLELIAGTHKIKTPVIIADGEIGDHAFLILEWIETGYHEVPAMVDFGIHLAKMHQSKTERYGLQAYNYIGSLIQHNDFSEDWTKFFVFQRLKPQIQRAFSHRLLKSNHLQQFDLLYKKLELLYENEKPCVVHGDLWGGNFMIDKLQQPVLIDPAAYYGNREVDIAMSMLFGDFGDDFYRAYQEVYPLKKGWRERCEIWNLYPLLVHLNLFGKSYLSKIEYVLKKYAN